MNYKDKYKEREPLETVEIVRDFFEKKGFKLDVCFTGNTNGLFSNRIRLFYDGIYIQGANGKGATMEYGLASGFAELYERFCNQMPGLSSSRLANAKAEEVNAECLKNAKFENIEEIFNEPHYRKYISYSNNEYFDKKIMQELIGKGVYCEPFKNILDESDVKYLNRNLEIEICNSTGMAAGNTFKEAFIQAFSELCERKAARLFFMDDCLDYVIIDPKNIKNANLKNIISKFNENQNDIYIVDFSYNYKVPVVMVILVEKRAGRIYTNFGSHPSFDIALERCLCEIVQGVNMLDETPGDRATKPFKRIDDRMALAGKATSSTGCVPAIKEVIFGRFSSKCPSDVWFKGDETTSIDDLYNYYLNYIRENDLKIYYLDTSLCDKMTALRLVNYEPEMFYETTFRYQDAKEKEFQILMNGSKLLWEIHESIIGPYDSRRFLNAFKTLTNPSFRENLEYLEDTMVQYYGAISPIAEPNGLGALYDMLRALWEGDIETLTYKVNFTFEVKSFRKFFELYSYMAERNYSRDEIKQYGKVLGFEYTDEDFDNYLDPEYVTIEILYKNIWNYYHSDSYKNYVLAATSKM